MKKTLILLLTAMTVLFAGCGIKDYTIPEKVIVRTDATYEFSVATLDSQKQKWLDFSEYLDVSKMISDDQSSSESNGMEILKYNNGSDYQQLLIHMPLKDIDFDLSETFEKMDFAKETEKFGIDESFTIDEITLDDEQKDKPIDLSNIQKSLNSGIKFEGTSSSNIGVHFDVTPGIVYFTDITYSSGFFIVKAKGSTLNGNVKLYHNDDFVSDADFINNTAKIPLQNKTIFVEDMNLRFDVTTNGEFEAYVEQDSKIKTANGVYLTGAAKPVVTPSDINIDFSLPSNVRSATITDGSIEMEIDRSNGWDSVITSYTIALSGGITETFTQSVTSKNAPIPLANANILAHPTVDVSFNGVDLDFEHGPRVLADVIVNKVTAVITTPDTFELTINKTEPVSEDMKKYVDKIYWNPSGFDVTAINSLPSGNDFELTFKSDFLNMRGAGVTGTIDATGNESPVLYHFTGTENQDYTTSFNDSNATDYFNNIVLLGEIDPPGDDTTGETITVTKVVPGQPYRIKLDIVPVFNWKSADVKLDDSSKMQDKFDSSINKKDLFKAFGDSFAENNSDKINFASLPLYIYATIPENNSGSNGFTLFDNIHTLNGKILAYYGKKEGDTVTQVGTEVKYLRGSATETADIELSPMPSLAKNADNFVTAEMTGDAIYFEDALNLPIPSNVEGASLFIDFDVQVGDGSSTINVTKAQMDQTKADGGTTKIKMDIIVVMTMDFTISEDVDLDIMELMNKDSSGTKTDAEKDLFKRTEGSSQSDYQKYLEIIKSAELEMSKTKFPFQGNLKMSVQWDNEDPEVFPLSEGEKSTFAVYNPAELLTIYPLEPKTKLVIGQGPFGIKREMPMEATLKLRVKAKGDIQVYPFSDSNEGEAN